MSVISGHLSHIFCLHIIYLSIYFLSIGVGIKLGVVTSGFLFLCCCFLLGRLASLFVPVTILEMSP